MKRRLVNVVTTLSLLLCVAVLVLWVRSYWIADDVLLYWGGRNDTPSWTSQIVGPALDVQYFGGCLTLFYQPVAVLPELHGWRHGYQSGRSLKAMEITGGRFAQFRRPSNHFLGFRWFTYPARPGNAQFLEVPSYPAAALTLALPAARMIAAWRRRRRFASHLCRDCGYDLRATPDLCPECGAPSPPI